MNYKKIYDFIKHLDKDNIEENKSQLMRYTIELMLSIKADDKVDSLQDLEDVFKTLLTREEFQEYLEKEFEKSNLKFGLLTEEFMKSYINFTNNIVENGYLKDAIYLTKRVLKGLGCILRTSFLCKRNIANVCEGLDDAEYEKKFEYIFSIEHLKDLQEEVRKHLNQDIKDMSKEIFNIWGLVEYIKNELDESVDETIRAIMSELKDKSLNEFNDEEDVEEYKIMFSEGYLDELNRRKYEWKTISSKFKGSYLRDELYKELEE